MRYILPEEGARTQSLPSYIRLPTTKSGSFRVLGNMVNIELVYRIASSLINDKQNQIKNYNAELQLAPVSNYLLRSSKS